MANADTENSKSHPGNTDDNAIPPAASAKEAAEAKAAAASEVEKLTAERAELNDRLLRTAAEFENYKRRIRKEMEDAGLRSLETLLKEILPPIDNLDRALVAARATEAKAPGLSALIEGVQMVQKQFFAALERFQIKPFEVQPGQPFDPQVHEAVQQVENASLPPGSVAVMFQRGYMAGSRLLRPAVVAVAKAQKPAETPPTEGAGDNAQN